MISQIEQTVFRLNNLDKMQEKINFQMGGKQIANGSDDSVLFGRIVSAEEKVRTYEGIKTQIERTDIQNRAADASVNDIKKILESIKSELMKANTDTTSDAGLKAIAVNLAGMKENLFTLANTQVEGEYVFAGSDSSIKPFEKQADGSIEYIGNNKLRSVAVEEGSYRERGINGFDMMMFTSSVAHKGETLTFNERDRILDQDGNEWKLNSPTNDTLTQYNVDGKATGVTITPVSFDPVTSNYSAAAPLDNGTKFEAKTNIFDLLNSVVKSLNMLDNDGNPISREAATAQISKNQDLIDSAFDGVNIAHAELGSKNKIFENSLDSVESKLTQFKLLESALSSSNLTEVAIKAKSLELTYAALYSTVMRTNELSLINFMK